MSTYDRIFWRISCVADTLLIMASLIALLITGEDQYYHSLMWGIIALLLAVQGCVRDELGLTMFLGRKEG